MNKVLTTVINKFGSRFNDYGHFISYGTDSDNILDFSYNFKCVETLIRLWFYTDDVALVYVPKELVDGKVQHYTPIEVDIKYADPQFFEKIEKTMLDFIHQDPFCMNGWPECKVN